MPDGTSTMRNGVDIDQLAETIAHVETDPGLARFEFRAHTRWIDGGRSETTIQEFHGAGREDESRPEPFVLEGDEPPVLLGTNQAPNAVETLLHALGSCLAVGYAYNAAAQEIELDRLELDIRGEMDLHGFLGISDEVRPGFDRIRIRARMDADASRERLEALSEHVQKTSPVTDMLRNPVPVDVELER